MCFFLNHLRLRDIIHFLTLNTSVCYLLRTRPFSYGTTVCVCACVCARVYIQIRTFNIDIILLSNLQSILNGVNYPKNIM